jgi:small subunit ribosomal protein S18
VKHRKFDSEERMKRNDEKMVNTTGDRDRGGRDFGGDRGGRDFGGGGRDFGGGGRGGDDRGGERRSFQRRKGCRFCNDAAILIDYKDKFGLMPFVTERFKIVPRRISGNCSSHQRELTTAIKRARHLAFLPYTTAQV